VQPDLDLSGQRPDASDRSFRVPDLHDIALANPDAPPLLKIVSAIAG
jgi:hypothetical protein